MSNEGDDTPLRGSGARDSAETLQRLWAGVEEVVTGSFLFRSLDEAGRRELVDQGVLMFFPAGKEILREGESGSDFYLVDRGVVEVTTLAPNGVPVVLSTLQRGAFFGEVAMLTGMPRTATVSALTDASAVRFDKGDIDQVLDRYPAARRLLQAMIKGRAKDTAEKMVKALSGPPPSKPTDKPPAPGEK